VVTTYRLSTIHHVVEIATTLARSWFRGHSRVIGELTPRVFRPEFDDDMLRTFRPALELEMIESFKADAPALAEGPTPPETDRLGWLYLMQHYRAPTRLLDWTGNALMALYFVVSEDKKVDGELWALNPQALNSAGEVGNALPLIGANPVLNYLVEEPYWAGKPEDLAARCKMTVVPRSPAAFPPRRNFARMIAQESVFTIHPRPQTGYTIPELLGSEKDLVRYIVPSKIKQELFHHLRALGINDRTVFPDFDGLSKHVIADSWTIAYSPPQPPTCDGPAYQ